MRLPGIRHRPRRAKPCRPLIAPPTTPESAAAIPPDADRLSNVLPNGGTVAWLQVAGSWLMMFSTMGVPRPTFSWIGSIQALLVFAFGAVVSPIYNRSFLRLLIIAGTFGLVFGHMMLSLCTEYWQAVLAQSFVVGPGGGCLFVPSLAIIKPYFGSRLGLALGIAATGSSWGAVSRMRSKPPAVRKMVNWTVFIDAPFCSASSVAFFYVPSFGQANGWVYGSLALYLLPILNAASSIRRVLPNWLTDKFGAINVIIPGSLLIGTVLCNLAVNSAAGIISTTIFSCFLSGLFVATPPLLFILFTEDKAKLGARNGVVHGMLVLACATWRPWCRSRSPARLEPP
ncbi:uncharacterized protein BDV17DRAFT_298927 [Aspergillus undulatus]|uniref:uncharacterized protein n=1 Tax=Aspergillus undulatus TaxID=1810928 RepID=UPI003CCD45C9